MIDKKWVGHDLSVAVLPLERTRLKVSPRRSARPTPYTAMKLRRGAAG